MYDNPDADGHEDPFSASSPPQKYIEAVTGAKFEVVVTLDPQFEFGNCDAVRVTIYPDNMNGLYADIKRKDEVERSLNCHSERFGSLRRYCADTHQWQRGDLTFGDLKIQETGDSNVSIKDIDQLGKIRVTWQRIYWGKKTERESNNNKPISKVTEKVLKGKAIENAIKLSNLQALKEGPRITQVEGIPLLGPMGRKVTMDILVQARLAELENRTSNTPQPSIKSEHRASKSNIKREREDKENESQRKRSRISGPAEVVDLTTD
ncbi:MAG: hypothetical protein Q9213_000083 [Squamulea squamosa]